MKKLLIAAFIVLALVLVSCGENEEKSTNESDVTVSEYSPVSIKDTLATSPALADTIIYAPETENVLDEDYFDYYFGSSELLSGISDYVYFTSATTAVREAGVFKVKDEKTKNALLEAFGARKENLKAIYENYSPEDVARADAMISGSFDDIVWFVATDDNNAIKEIIE